MRNPPRLRGRSDPVFDRLGQSPHKERLCDYLALLKPLDDRGRYLSYDALRYRWAPGLDSNLCWALVKKARAAQYSRLMSLGEPSRWLQFVMKISEMRTLADLAGHVLQHRGCRLPVHRRNGFLRQRRLQANYLHPLIKGIALHFALGYEHPFRDGNGRVARALFYWFMFKNDYSAFRYIAISVLLRNAPVKYGRSYLDTEADDLDLTYFIDFQCSVVLRAVGSFTEAYRKSLIDAQQFDCWLQESGFLEQLTEKQRALYQVAKSGMAKEFTAGNVKENLGCSYNTASATLNGLVELKLFEKRRMGRECVYFLREPL
ncbi:Fic family protein [Pseudomonas sp. NFX98]|uniref:Fic family protein n=1 Tax=Pseudomonas sp. NFX98 TaxID=3399122 RepID=UPI0039FC9661